METLLWISIGCILYGYVGYPLLITIISVVRGRVVRKNPDYRPTVSLIIPAHNEVKVIRKKLDNALTVDYPREYLEIVVVSDESTDGTDEIVKEYDDRGIQLIRLEPRGGKNRAVNSVVPQVNGEIVVLCDANIMFESSAISKIIENFADPSVGCVCGQKLYREDEGMATGKGEGLYWKLEEYLKRRESLAGSVTGADGSMYAIRKSLFRPFDIALMDDLLVSLNIYHQGFRIVSEPDARAYEKATTVISDEFRRKNRIVASAIRTYARNTHFLNPFKSGLMSWQIWSHKFCRWLVPFFLIAAAFALINLVTQERYIWLAVLSALFIVTAVVGGLMQREGKGSGLLSFPFYFLLVNTAALLGWLKFIGGKVETTWKKPESSRV